MASKYKINEKLIIKKKIIIGIKYMKYLIIYLIYWKIKEIGIITYSVIIECSSDKFLLNY